MVLERSLRVRVPASLRRNERKKRGKKGEEKAATTHLELVRVRTDDGSNLLSALEEHESGHRLDSDLSGDLLLAAEDDEENEEKG